MIDIVKNIVKREGKYILRDEKRFIAFVNDLSPQTSEEKNILKNLARCGVLREYLIIDESESGERNLLLDKLSLRMKNEFGIKEEWIQASNNIFSKVFEWQLEIEISKNSDISIDTLERLTLAMEYAKRKEYDKAEVCLKQLVDTGSPMGMAKLGELYLYAYPSKWKNDKKYENIAISLLTESADKGCTEAYFQLAPLHRLGRYGLEKSDKIAFEYMKKAESKGDMKAASALAFSYFNGVGVEQSVTKAVELLKIASEFEEKHAMNLLADCYVNGNGVEMSLDKAKYWKDKAERIKPDRWGDSIRYFSKQIEIVMLYSKN